MHLWFDDVGSECMPTFSAFITSVGDVGNSSWLAAVWPSSISSLLCMPWRQKKPLATTCLLAQIIQATYKILLRPLPFCIFTSQKLTELKYIVRCSYKRFSHTCHGTSRNSPPPLSRWCSQVLSGCQPHGLIPLPAHAGTYPPLIAKNI